MPDLNIYLSDRNVERLRVVAERLGTMPRMALQAHVSEWLKAEAPDVFEPGVTPAPPGMFPDDGCEYTFFDPSQANPGRAEDFMTPEQRQKAVAEILATIALRVARKQQEGELAEPE